MRSSLSCLRSLSFSLHHHYHLRSLPTTNPQYSFSSVPLVSYSTYSHSTFVEHSASRDSSSEEEGWDYFKVNVKAGGGEGGSLGFDVRAAGSETMKHMGVPSLEVKELEELPVEWRRSKLTRLCKELTDLWTIDKILKAAGEWLRQEDATYVVVHFIRIRKYRAAYLVYEWMMRQHWCPFDFALATKLTNFLVKERNFTEWRMVYDGNILVYNMYLESLSKAANVEKAEEVFNKMLSDETIGIDARSCNSILSVYVARSTNSILSRHPSYKEHKKVEDIYNLMLGKDYDIEPRLERDLDYILMMIRKGLV